MSARSVAVVMLFASTLLLSAFLLFVVEPIVAKTLLPTLGGAPMVWNTCVMFFQIVLLGGYVYAYGATKWLGPRRHAVVYAILLALPLVVLPFSTSVLGGPSANASPISWLLLLLFRAIGLPFFVLSTSAVVLQSWFSTTDDWMARDPYFLYVASNLGSLLALISYSSIVEPTLRLRDQSRVWALGYAVFVALAYVCAAVVWRRGTSVREASLATIRRNTASAAPPMPVSVERKARWAALSFIPSSLMLGVTTYLSTDIAAVPLLWIVPLSLYLITFVVAFGSRSRSVTAIADRGLPLVILPLALLMAGQVQPSLWLLLLHLVAFAMVGLLCHGALARDRPSPSSLTEFYFWIACGGMLGGVFNTLAAPILFKSVVEYPLVLVFGCFFRSGVGTKAEPSHGRTMDVVVPLAIGALSVGLVVAVRGFNDPRANVAVLTLPAFLSFSQSRRHPTRFTLALGAMLLVASLGTDVRGRTLHAERTFFGVYRVSVDTTGQYRALFHGTTLHGMQAIDQARQHEPLTYFHRTGPFGQALAQLPNVANATDIAVVGLGVGSLASYATAGQHWTFYELDPAVERLARTTEYFTYLRDCGDRCRVVLGDARISLAGARPNQYGLIVLDAFSSDAIPVHLLTTEAFTLYLSRLAAGGVLALHISNRHLELGPMLARQARSRGLTAIEQRERVTDEAASKGKSASDWLVMAPNPADLGSLGADTRWVVPVVSGSTPLWTDDSSSILSVLRFR